MITQETVPASVPNEADISGMMIATMELSSPSTKHPDRCCSEGELLVERMIGDRGYE